MESNTERGFESGHPLLYLPVLQLIFKDLDLKHLKICRFLCQDWNTFSLLQIKNNSRNHEIRICLSNEGRLKEFMNNETRFCEFQRFKVEFSIQSEAILNEFMDYIKNQLKDIIFVIGNNNQEIKAEFMDKFLAFLARHSNNCESFGLEINEESSRDVLKMPFETYDVNWTNLKSLSISKVPEFSIFIPILEKASKSEKLKIINGPLYSTYQPLLKNFIPTLIEFNLVGFSGDDEEFVGVNQIITPFSELKRLRIYELAIGYELTIPAPALPELCELSLSLGPCTKVYFEDLAVYPKLSFLNWDKDIREEDFRKMSHIFPNLKRLHIKCRNSSDAGFVWKYLKGIEELRMSGLGVNDKGIIGFDTDLRAVPAGDLLHDPKTKGLNWTSVYEFEKNSNRTYEQCNGIRALSGLKRITISAYQISNQSFIFGLLKCKSLRNIQLIGPSPYLTKDILKFMADELQLMNLSIDVSSSNSNWGSTHKANYFRRKHPLCQLHFPYFPTQTSQFLTPEDSRWMF